MPIRSLTLVVLFLIALKSFGQKDSSQFSPESDRIFITVSAGTSFLERRLSSEIKQVQQWFDDMPIAGRSLNISVKEYGEKHLGFGILAQWNSKMYQVHWRETQIRQVLNKYNFGMGLTLSLQNKNTDFDLMPFFGVGILTEKYVDLENMDKRNTLSEFGLSGGIEGSAKIKITTKCKLAIEGTFTAISVIQASGGFLDKMGSLRLGFSYIL